MSGRNPGRPRRTLILVCVIVAVALLTTLGYEAVAAARARRRTAESVLRDYASLAASQYARSASAVLEYDAFLPLLGLLESGEVPVDPIAFEATVEGQWSSARLGTLADALFELEPAGELSSVLRPDPPRTGDGRRLLEEQIESGLASRAEDAPYGFRIVVSGDTVAASGEALIEGDAEASGDAAAVSAVVSRADDRGVVRGFRTAPGALERHLADAVDDYPLLPESLTDGDDEGLVAIRVSDTEGRVLLSTDPDADFSLAAETPLGSRLPGLVVRAAIQPAAAERLVLGGLPRSRLPWIGAALTLALGLLVAAGALARRERELVRLREEFVAGVSHELRTPLAQIRMATETLRLDRVRSEEERRRYLGSLDREARRLGFLVENLLQFSRHGRRPEPVPEPTDLEGLARDVVEAFEPVAATRRADVRVQAGGDTRACVDRSMTRQVLSNLLDNATKYGPGGQTVTVTVRGAEGRVVVTVDDQGPGVAAAHRDRIWERFWRGPGVDASTGTGIGLALVRELVEAQGGEATVEDAPDGGARFVVCLPRETAP